MVKKKKIWLVNQYAMPPKHEVRIQTIKRAQYLIADGYDVSIIGGSFLHNTNINLINNNKWYTENVYEGIKFIHIKTCSYATNGIKRIYSLIEFPIRLFLLANKLAKPDVISHVATVPFGNLIFFIAKKYKAKYIVDVVDLWPETFVALGLISKNNLLLKFAYWAEYWLYKKADAIVFSMEGGRNYIIEKGWDLKSGGSINLDKVFYINNGVDLADFDKNKELYRLSDPDLENDNTFKVIYIGSIRLANNLKQLIDAAELLLPYENIQFFIYGDGDERQGLEKYCEEKKITNVSFKQKWIEIKYVPYVLSKSSLNVLNYLHSPILRFGGSQSKSFQYMASGKPICANLKMNFCPISKFKIGVAREFSFSKEYAETILSFAKMTTEEYSQLCRNARIAAAHYDYKTLTAKFTEII